MTQFESFDGERKPSRLRAAIRELLRREPATPTLADARRAAVIAAATAGYWIDKSAPLVDQQMTDAYEAAQEIFRQLDKLEAAGFYTAKGFYTDEWMAMAALRPNEPAVPTRRKTDEQNPAPTD